jgi:hypothetical protein
LSLEFAVEFSCLLRSRYTETHLRAWGPLGNLHARLTTRDMAVPSAEKDQFVEDSSTEIELMQRETAICSSCPACLPQEFAGEGESVGCLGRINYPIEAQFEKFLADRIQLALDTIDAEDLPRLMRILVDPESPFDGEGAKELRRVTTAEGLRFFELRIPISLARDGYKITTDHIFDLLSGFTSADAGVTTYAREIPLSAAADYYDFLDHVLRSELTASESLRLHSRGKSYVQFLRLLAAFERSEMLQSRLLLD